MKRCSPGDASDVVRILKDDTVFGYVTDDGMNDPELLKMTIQGILHNPAVYILMPNPNAVFMFIPLNYAVYDVHVGIIAGGGRSKSYELGLECFRWMVEHTEAMKFIARGPVCNPTVVDYLKRCRLSHEGTLTESFIKDGKAYDMEIYCATRQDVSDRRD